MSAILSSKFDGKAHRIRHDHRPFCKWDVPDEVFMARELRPGALKGIKGLVAYEVEFDLA